jgi:signal transduction histidine kinase
MSLRSAPARPRIRTRLRLIALGLVLLPTLAIALLVRGAMEAEQQAKQRSEREREARLVAGTEALAQRLGAQTGLFPEPARERFSLLEAVPPVSLAEPVILDGRCADWLRAGTSPSQPCEASGVRFDRAEYLTEASEDYAPSGFSFAVLTGAGERAGYLHLFVRVFDDDHAFRRGALDEADHLRLAVALPSADGTPTLSRFVVVPEPGEAGAVTTYQVEPGWRQEVAAASRLPWGNYLLPPFRRPYGAWRPSAGGYDVELRLPLVTLGPRWRETELGLAVVDVDAAGDPKSMWVVPRREGALAVAAPDAERFARAWRRNQKVRVERRLAVFDARGRELLSDIDAGARAEVAALLATLASGASPSASAPAQGLAGTRVTDEGGALLGFVVRQDASPDPGPRLAGIAREIPLMAAILAGALLLLFVVLAYTGRLSRRILALVDHVGADRDANDEIGELSRRLSDLIERDRAHREYLQQLPRILGHETLGPLGVVKMALDDLHAEDPAVRSAAQRAIHSIQELIDDLREATSLEDALERGERVEVDLVGLVREAANAYGNAKRAELEIDLPSERFETVVIERRIEQLLEKLLDNAVDFSDDEPVRLGMECGDGAARIRVENSGSQLPEGPAAEQIFIPLHSGRKRTAERHLGLGLYVARVIARQHGGDIRAWNASENRVVFEVTIRGAA